MNAVITAYCGDHGKALKPLSQPGIENYARKCHAAFECYEANKFNSMLDKMEFTRHALDKYDRILWLDADTLVRNDMPDLFQLVPSERFASVNHCSYVNDEGIYLLHQDVVRWCCRQHKPIPDMRDVIFCMGIYLVPKEMRLLFEPFEYPDNHDWVEQTGVNVRLGSDHSLPIYVLPWCFSHFVYWPYAPCRKIDESNFALHYAGPPSKEQRLTDMAKQIEKWNREGLY